MDLKRKLIGALFAVIAGSGLLIACGPESGAACEFDTDCSDEELCAADGYCAYECGDGLPACEGTEVCTTRTNATDGSKVCLPPGGTVGNNNNGNNNQNECTTNEECQDKLDNDDAICDTSGAVNVCEIIGQGQDYFTVQVKDVTTAPDRCEDTTGPNKSPATKLSYVQLLSAGGQTLGWGEAVGDDIRGGSDFNEVYTVLDGGAPGLDGECAESFTTDNGVALGCGGHVMVQFIGNDEKRVKLEDGQQVFVGIYGNVCNAQFDKAFEDKYNVYLCDFAGDTAENDSSCTTLLSPAPHNGHGVVDIKLPS